MADRTIVLAQNKRHAVRGLTVVNPQEFSAYQEDDDDLTYIVDMSSYLDGATISSVTRTPNGVTVSNTSNTTTRLTQRLKGFGYVDINVTSSSGEVEQFRITVKPRANSAFFLSNTGSVPQNTAQLWNVVADVTGSNIDDGISWIRTAGYYAVGDGGGALYKRVYAAPSHGAYITSNAATAYWELAETLPSVLQTGARGDGSTDDKTAFQSAADFSANVIVPPRTYAIGSTVTGTTRWWLQKGSDITGQSDVGNNNLPNTSRLSGRVFWFVDSSTRGGMIAGDSDLWAESLRNPSLSLAEFGAVSPTGQVGVLGASRTGDDPSANQACIGIYGLANNNNTSSPEAAWGSYFEARRQSGAGATFGIESSPVNLGSAVEINPYTTISGNAHTVAAWLTSGGEVAGAAKCSAAIGVHNNGASFDRGIVFVDGSIDSTLSEAVTMYAPLRVSWYDSSGLKSYSHDTGGQLLAKSDTAATGVQYEIKRRAANGTDATGSIYEIGRWNFYGYNSGDYLGGYIQTLQRTAFSGGNARFSIDLSAKNAAGSDMQVTLNGITDSAFTPFPSDTIACGSSSGRWSDVVTQTLTLASYTVAGLPTGAAGKVAFASNGRKNGEGAGAGTGVLVFHDGTAWRACDTGATVAA